MTEPPKKQPTDIAHAVTKAALGVLSAGMGAELFSLVVAPPIETRRDEWMDSVAERLAELERRVDGFTVNDLQHDEAFITVIAHATTTALKNHNETKLEMLRNAVLNTAIGFELEDSMQLIFLRLVEELTPLHLKLLAFLDDPRGYGAASGIEYPNWSSGSISHVIEIALPELSGQRAVYDQLAKDLESRGLIAGSGLHGMMTAQGMFASRTTELAKSFIAFVKEPVV